MKMVGCVVALLLVQPSPGNVLPIYRDVLKSVPFSDATYYDRCGVGTGPLEILRPETSRADAAAIVRDLDAAGVPAMAEKSLARAAQVLPGATVTICLYPGELSRGLPYLDGVGGLSLGGGRIKLLLHPKPGGLRRVAYTVAHEYHHEVERNLGPGGYDPIDIVIREGKADYFAVALYPDLRPRHTLPLSEAELKAAWRDLLDYERSQPPPSTFRSDFMIGKNVRVTPWPGYRLGYEMVETYFRDKQAGPMQVIKAPARVIFDNYVRRGRK